MNKQAAQREIALHVLEGPNCGEIGGATLHSLAGALLDALAALDSLTARLAQAEGALRVLRLSVQHVINDSPGTPESVKGFLAHAVTESVYSAASVSPAATREGERP